MVNVGQLPTRRRVFVGINLFVCLLIYYYYFYAHSMFVTLRTVQIIFVVGSLLPLISPSIPYGRTLQILVHMHSLAYR